MMVTTIDSQVRIREVAFPAGPDKHREQLLNLLCEVRQDSRFAEWCHLARALGLGGLTLRALADLHEGTAEALIPELLNGEILQTANLGLVPGTLPDGRDGVEDTISQPTELPGWSLNHATLPAPPNAEAVIPLRNGSYDGRASAAAS